MKKNIFFISLFSVVIMLLLAGCPGSFGPTLDIEFQKLNREPGEPIVMRAIPDGFTPTGNEDYIWSVYYKKPDDIGYSDLNVHQPFEDDQALIYIPAEVKNIKVEVETYITHEGKSRLVSDRKFLYPSNKKDVLVEVFDPQENFNSPDNWFKNEEYNSDRTPAYFRYITDFDQSVVIVPENPYEARVDYVKMSPNNYTDIGETGVIYGNGKDKFLRSEYSYSFFDKYFNSVNVTGRWNITISKNNPLDGWRAKNWHVEIGGQADQSNNKLFIFRAQKDNSSDFVVTDIIDITHKLPNPSEEFEPTVVITVEFDISEDQFSELSGDELWGENSYFGIILTEGSTLKGIEMVFSPDIEY
ncbi:MAG: hypothetical protein R6U52_02465 [Kosmotogaceae bacterium]